VSILGMPLLEKSKGTTGARRVILHYIRIVSRDELKKKVRVFIARGIHWCTQNRCLFLQPPQLPIIRSHDHGFSAGNYDSISHSALGHGQQAGALYTRILIAFAFSFYCLLDGTSIVWSSHFPVNP